MSAQDADTDSGTGSQTNSTGLRATADTDLLKPVLDACQAASAEIKAPFYEDRVVLASIDGADVLMCQVTVPEDSFSEYDVTPPSDDGSVLLGLEYHKLKRVGLVGDYTELKFPSDNYRLGVESGGIDASIGMLDPETISGNPLPEKVWDRAEVHFTAQRGNLRDMLGAIAETAHKAVEIRAGSDGVTLHKTGDTDKIDAELPDAEIIDEPAETQKVLMNQEYISDVLMAMPKDTEFDVYAKTDFPMAIEYEIDEGATVKFVQAPRLDR